MGTALGNLVDMGTFDSLVAQKCCSTTGGQDGELQVKQGFCHRYDIILVTISYTDKHVT